MHVMWLNAPDVPKGSRTFDIGSLAMLLWCFGDCSGCYLSEDADSKFQGPFRLNAYEIRARGDQSSTKGETTTSARHDP